MENNNFEHRFDKLESKVDKLTEVVSKIVRVEEQLSSSSKRMDQLEGRVDKNERDIDKISDIARANGMVAKFADKLFWLMLTGVIGIIFYLLQSQIG